MTMPTTITQLQQQLRRKEISARELAQQYLGKSQAANERLNCYINFCPELAEQQAAAADARLARDPDNAPPLTGIPLAVKDIFCLTGAPTTCGSRMLENYHSPFTATAVDNMLAAGCSVIGKTNCDEFAMGSTNENSYFGAAKNPIDTKLVPGGSSGGSAVAVAADLAPAALGTDTGGSIRQPAAFCGVSGIKPTYGSVSRYGMVAYASSLDQGGVFANNAEDLALLLNALVSHDSKDSTSTARAPEDFAKLLQQPISGVRIGVPQEFFSDALDAGIAQCFEASMNALAKLGAKIVPISLPNFKLAISAYYVIALAECSANLARYDGVRYGYRCSEPQDLEDLYTRSRSEGFGSEVKRRILLGTYVLSTGYYDAYYLQAQKIRRIVRQDLLDAYQQVDLIAGPVTPTPAFALGDKVDDPVSMYLQDIYTVFVNLAGLPAASIPMGTSGGLPTGLHLVGPHFAEAQILQLAQAYERSGAKHGINY